MPSRAANSCSSARELSLMRWLHSRPWAGQRGGSTSTVTPRSVGGACGQRAAEAAERLASAPDRTTHLRRDRSMSSQFQVDTDRITAASGDINRIGADIDAQVSAMMARLTGLQDAWTGSAATRFQGVAHE